MSSAAKAACRTFTEDFESAIAAMTRERAEALIILGDPLGVDAENEELIQEAIRRLAHGGTSKSSTRPCSCWSTLARLRARRRLPSSSMP